MLSNFSSPQLSLVTTEVDIPVKDQHLKQEKQFTLFKKTIKWETLNIGNHIFWSQTC